MEFEIFIKDNAFIPDTVDIKTYTTVIFRNEDGTQHNIHCKGSMNFPLLTVNAGKSERYMFGIPGKYMISDSGYGDMKVSAVFICTFSRETISIQRYFLPLVCGGSHGSRAGEYTQAELLSYQ